MWRRLLRPIPTAASLRRWLGRPGIAPVIVLCYHDLREPDGFTSWLRVDVNTFSDQIATLSKLGTFVEPDALESLGELPRDRLHFLVTFDDGYPNNLRLAADVLAQADVPALFFISTHHLLTGESFWFDRVVTRVQAARLENLDLSAVGLRMYRFHRTDGARRWDDIQALLADLIRLGNPNEKRVARVLDLLDSKYGAVARPSERWCRPMNVTELAGLAKRCRAFFGSHAHRHELLTDVADDALAQSLSTSKRILEELLGTTTEDFSYPNSHVNDRVRNACAAAGYRRAYVAEPAVVPAQPDMLRIPRFQVGGYDSSQDVVSGIIGLLRGRGM